MHYVDAFAGAGGLSLGLDAAGHQPLAMIEVAEAPRAVLRRAWPGVEMLRDVRDVQGHRWQGQVELLAGGSPCQDLSTAGLGRGIMEGPRSSLFFHLVRLWDECGAPLLLWENVYGALGNNGGRDFAAVLSAIVGASVTAGPTTKPWRDAGVAVGPRAVAAWRVLDLWHWGVPQRRRRVFVVGARPGSADPSEILALGEGVCGCATPRRIQAQIASAIERSDDADSGAVCTYHERDAEQCGCLGESGFWCGACGRLTSRLHYDPSDGCSHCGADPSWYRDIANTLTDGAHHGGGLNGQDFNSGRVLVAAGRPRRLTPVECERLMGWPDGHTEKGVDDDGRSVTIKDGARFLMCANGVGLQVGQWLGERLNLARQVLGA